MKESDVKVEVLEADHSGAESSDYFSSPVFINNGIPIGASGDIATVLYVRVAQFEFLLGGVQPATCAPRPLS
jgi:hypothetical protein